MLQTHFISFSVLHNNNIYKTMETFYIIFVAELKSRLSVSQVWFA